MTNRQDANSKAEAGESLEDVAENIISATPEKDALGENSMGDVSGGSWPYNNLARASYISSGSGG